MSKKKTYWIGVQYTSPKRIDPELDEIIVDTLGAENEVERGFFFPTATRMFDFEFASKREYTNAKKQFIFSFSTEYEVIEESDLFTLSPKKKA